MPNGVEVTITKYEYQELVRDNERLKIVKDYVSNAEFISKKEIMTLLGMEEKKGGKKCSLEN